MGKQSRGRGKSVKVSESPTGVSRLSGRLRGFGIFIAGTVFGLYVVHWFVEFLPGPEVGATVQGLRGTTPNTSGCVYYTLMVRSGQPIEYVYLKTQFPGKVGNFKVGLPQEAQSAMAGRIAMQAWEAGKDENGNCTIVQAAVNNTADVQASAAGNMITIHASKLPSNTYIMGMVATVEGESSVKPSPTGLFIEGEYEYVKLGQTVRKVLPISNKGVTDTK